MQEYKQQHMNVYTHAKIKDYYYLTCVLKSEDAFWLVNFASETSNKNKYQPLFKKWAKTIKFTK